MKQTYEELERERNELAAQVERLSGALGVLIWQAEQVDSWERFPSLWIDDAQSVANEQPSTALAALKSQWQAEAVNHCEKEVTASVNVLLKPHIAGVFAVIRQHAQEASNANSDNKTA